MVKYIDAEKLKEKIKQRLDELNPETGMLGDKPLRSVNPKTFPRESELEKVLCLIDSLQQEQSIDKNILTWRDVNELERLINKVHYEFRNGINEESFGKLVLERFIGGKDDLQELTEVNLEKEIERYQEHYTLVKEKGLSLNWMDIETTARHFYELGLNARKEE